MPRSCLPTSDLTSLPPCLPASSEGTALSLPCPTNLCLPASLLDLSIAQGSGRAAPIDDDGQTDKVGIGMRGNKEPSDFYEQYRAMRSDSYHTRIVDSTVPPRARSPPRGR